jgi:hypothetical protein
MKEYQLQLIWEQQDFPKHPLFTTCGKPLVVFTQGKLNKDQGPDFSLARIMIDQHEWVGHVELHVRTSDWYLHGHHHDSKYRNVILHVVWIHDSSIFDHAPVLELSSIIGISPKSDSILMPFAKSKIRCSGLTTSPPSQNVYSWLSMLGNKRIEHKANQVLECLDLYKGDWDSATWLLMVKGFGYRVNADSFYALARSIPFYLVRTYKYDLHMLEALLFGQSGLLDQPWRDQYPQRLSASYKLIKHKFGLVGIANPLNFLRMRPNNFPTIRISQLASLYHHRQHIFRYFIDAQHHSDLHAFLRAGISCYWENHSTFDALGPRQNKLPGTTLMNSLIINVVVPILVAYSRSIGNQLYRERAMGWMQSINAESNSILDQFSDAGFLSTTAFESQSLLELHQCFCSQGLCQQCVRGQEINWAN